VDHRVVRWQKNPLYRGRTGWEMHGRALWFWRGLPIAIAAVYALYGYYVVAAIIIAGSVVAEIVRLRRERRRASAGESTGEGGEDR
jgi:hypothetical protein